MSTHPSPSIILYDGVCSLCDFAVQFILPRDHRRQFRFASLQGAVGRDYTARYHLPFLAEPESLILIEDGQAFQRSHAVLKIASHLRYPWPLLQVFYVIPEPLRDALYRWVARNRYRWFGKFDACLLPKPEWRDRFLDPL